MTFKLHNERRYARSQLVKSADFSLLHIQHRRLEPGLLDPITFKCNEIDMVLSGQTLTERKANGWTQRSFLRPGISRASPIGTHEDFAEITDPLDILNIYFAVSIHRKKRVGRLRHRPCKDRAFLRRRP